MKSILIVGKNSYIGGAIKEWLNNKHEDFQIDSITVRDDSWRLCDFSKYDVVIHVAGMVHVKEKRSNWSEYERLNASIPFQVAQRAKEAGVKQFIFFSTKGVYTPNTAKITRDTIPNPTKLYGQSKLEGERKILSLKDNTFSPFILRPAVVYGEGCKGNFPRLIKLSRIVHFFPDNSSKRSMIYIWNLCEYVRMLIVSPLSENILFPQDRLPVGTKDILVALWSARGEKYYLSKVLDDFVQIMKKIPGLETIKTMFSDTVYDEGLSSDYNYDYCVYSFNEAINRCVRDNER